MKKLICSALIILAILSQGLRAQENKSDFRFTIKTNPLASLGGPLWIAIIPITGEYKVLFEAKTFNKQSIELGLGYLGPSVLLKPNDLSDNDSISGIKISGFRAQVAYKFFITKDAAPEGFYIAPHFSYAAAKIKSKDNAQDNFEAIKLNLNILIGYQLITNGGFTLNIYTGMGFKHREYNISIESEDIFNFKIKSPNSANVPFGFTFGYAF